MSKYLHFQWQRALKAPKESSSEKQQICIQINADNVVSSPGRGHASSGWRGEGDDDWLLRTVDTQNGKKRREKTHTPLPPSSSSSSSPLSKIYGIGAVSTPTAAATAHTDGHTHSRRWQRSAVEPVSCAAIGGGFPAPAAAQQASHSHTRHTTCDTMLLSHLHATATTRQSDSSGTTSSSSRGSAQSRRWART